MDAANSTKSFIRKGTLPAIAGNPPADAAQPFAINEIIVTVPMNVIQEPSAPSIPNLLSYNPMNKSAPNNHSEMPKNQLKPRTPKTGYNQKISGPLLIYGINTCASYSHHF